jgi:Cdc6-like AAA superfamily ATPase
LEWLTPLDYFSEQSDFVSIRQEDTGQWLLQSTEYEQWLHGNKQTLFCSGIPGAGKTIITSIVIEHLQEKFQDDHSVGIAYVYCNYGRQQEQKPDNLLSCFLKHLVHQKPSIPEDVMSLYKSHNNKRRPKPDEVQELLRSIIKNNSKSFIIIDALDECQVSNGDRKTLLREIFDLQAKSEFCLFATSRFIPDVVEEFKGSLSLEIRAHDNDVKRYLSSQMKLLPNFVLRNADLQEEIKNIIIDAIGGMYVLSMLIW